MAAAGRRASSIGVAFDIDGVVMKGDTMIPGADRALRRLDAARVPYIFLTNGGGMMEWKKGQSVQKATGVAVDGESQVICSHTPFRAVVNEFRDRRVLILGSREVMDVARQYGLRDPVSVHMLAEVRVVADCVS